MVNQGSSQWRCGLLVDATGAQRGQLRHQHRLVGGGASWATPVAPEQDLGALLILTKPA